MNKQNIPIPPDENKMEELLAKIQPVPGAEFHQKMARAPWRAVKTGLVAENIPPQGDKMNTTRPRRLSRVAYAALVLIALFTLAFVTPQGRALAQNILQFFTRAESNTLELSPSQIPEIETVQADSTALPPSPLTNVAKAEAQAGFDAAELPVVPEGFNYLGARLYGNAISIEYEAQGGGANLIIMQSRDGFIQSDWDQVPANAIVPVKIGDLDGEFVQGTFVVYAGDTSATWNPEAAILRLRWELDGTWVDMTKFGDVERIEYLDQAGLIKLAERLTYDPFPLDVNTAKSQAGFDVWEPVRLPVGMTFLGAAFDPSLKIVSQSFGYTETDRRILIKQQPVNTGEACDLCGIVGASAAVETIQIGTVTGEYALGVWNLTDTGPVWQDDPYLKTIRWHKDGMAFELLFMGMEVERDELISIAAGLK